MRTDSSRSPWTVFRLSLALLVSSLVGLAVEPVSATYLETHSFEPPYTSVDPSGNRLVSKEWKNGGVTAVNQNFVRLTPDRQSKKGALWSKKKLGTSQFSSTMKFRISGQGKKFFGDGMAFWCIQQAYYVEGDLHGSVERFTGIGIIFDTFKNTETLSYHRDVSIIINDGEKTTEMMMEKVDGCDANIRYHEDRADFSVDSTSRVKILVNGRNLEVLIDEKNDGEFKSCANTELPFAEDWAKNSHIGITGSTGQLADNHDVISLVTFTDAEKHAEHEAIVLSSRKFERGSGSEGNDLEERLGRLEDAVDRVLAKLSYIEHHTEHELASVEDHMKVTVSKLQSQEAISEGRLDELEKKVLNSVQGSIGEQVDRSVDHIVANQMGKVENLLKDKIQNTVSKTVSNMSGWKWPFFFLLLIMGGGFFGMQQWYKKELRKTHLP